MSTVLEKRVEVLESDLARYGEELITVFKLHDAKKRAKTEVAAAQAKYEKACADVLVLKERTMSIFDELNSNDS